MTTSTTTSPLLGRHGAVAGEGADAGVACALRRPGPRAAAARGGPGDGRPVAPGGRHRHRARPVVVAALDDHPAPARAGAAHLARDARAVAQGARRARPAPRRRRRDHVDHGRAGHGIRAGGLAGVDALHAAGRGGRRDRRLGGARASRSVPSRPPASRSRGSTRGPASGRHGRLRAGGRVTRPPGGPGASCSCRAPSWRRRSATARWPAPGRTRRCAWRRSGPAWASRPTTAPSRTRSTGSRTAVHLQKGCYRGQETVARVHNLGRPPRRLVFLHLDGSGHVLPERRVARAARGARGGPADLGGAPPRGRPRRPGGRQAVGGHRRRSSRRRHRCRADRRRDGLTAADPPVGRRRPAAMMGPWLLLRPPPPAP